MSTAVETEKTSYSTGIEVRVFFGLTAWLGGAGRAELDPHIGPASAASVAEELGLPLDEVGLVMVNGRCSSLESAVSPGDRVAYFPPYVPYHKVYGMCVI